MTLSDTIIYGLPLNKRIVKLFDGQISHSYYLFVVEERGLVATETLND